MDFFGWPSKTKNNDVQIFNPNAGVNLQGLQQWNKPKGSSLVTMIAVAGGGGGGGGLTRTAGSAGGGGGGGACSGIARFICPAVFLPDELWVQVGGGGVGGAANGAGGNGLNSFILTAKTAVLPNIVLASGVNAPGGGGAGFGAGAGPAGTVPTIAVTQPMHVWGQWAAIVGLVGVVGGAQTGAAGTSVTAWAAIPFSPGAGGGGCTTTNFSGGNQTPTALLDIGSQGYYASGVAIADKGAGGAAPGNDGGGGIERLTPFFNCGGAGGGSNNSGQAGNGANGGIGCGGGGGGAGTTGGQGGNGGDGLVVIISI